MAYSPASITSLPKRLRPRMVVDCDPYSNIISMNPYSNPVYYQQTNYQDFIGAAQQQQMNAGLSNMYSALASYGSLPAKQPLPVKPAKSNQHYTYELIQDIKAGAPFVIPKLLSPDEAPKQLSVKSSTEETVLAAVDLGNL